MHANAFNTISDCALTPADMLARWPAHLPLMMLHSGRFDARWARWSLLATPIVRFQFDSSGRSQWVGTPPPALKSVHFTHDPLRDLDAILAATCSSMINCNNAFPFHSGWIGYCSYDLGRVIEPRAQTLNGAKRDRYWPLIDLAWCSNAILFDHLHKHWHAVGEDAASLMDAIASSPPTNDAFAIESLRPMLSPAEYVAMVRRTKQYIAAGDIFQANIAQRFTAHWNGSPRTLAVAAFEQALPWYGAYTEFFDAGAPDRCVLSLSPELFLHVDSTSRRITTRPIKGTRPSNESTQSLLTSVKDTAELHMIIDLMRNDLGRVCEISSISVPQPRAIETHPTVHHGVGEVSGILREDATFGDVLRATFSGGSVTGAPKIRAMQIIDELEPVRRGPYCGAIGMISDSGNINLNIAIRTMLIERDRVDYSAGAGIVADSDPQSEYEETLAKAAILQQIHDAACKAPACAR